MGYGMVDVMREMYALIDPKDGERLSYRPIRNSEDALTHEVVIEEEPPPGSVWDAGSGEPRQPSEAEMAEAKKPEKLAELQAAAVEELAPLFTEGAGDRELLFLLAAHVKRLCEALGVEADPRLARVEEAGRKALAKRDEARDAATVAELEGVTW